MLGIFGIILTAVSGIYTGFIAYIIFFSFSHEKIGIIGGADSPTAICLLGNVGVILFLAVIGFIMGVLCIVFSSVLLLKKGVKIFMNPYKEMKVPQRQLITNGFSVKILTK